MSEEEQAGRQAQRELYGEPLADIAGRVMTALGLTQGRLADALQLSAPMLSQLMTGHRVKIGNPAVVHRLQALVQLADEAPALGAQAVADRISHIRAEQASLTGSRPDNLQGRGVALAVLRSLASPGELAEAASGTSSVALARLLREAAEQSGRG